MSRARIRKLENGNFLVNLREEEKIVLRDLPIELIKLLEAGDDDGSIFRLFPPGYTNDLGRQLEYDRLMRDELQKRHVEALRLLEDTISRPELTEDELFGWLKAINQLRLVLGTRLDVSSDDLSPITNADDPRASAYALYEYLGLLQDEAVQAASGGGEPTGFVD